MEPSHPKGPPVSDAEIDGLVESLTGETYREEQPTIPVDPEPIASTTRKPTPAPAPLPAEGKPRVPRPPSPRIPRPSPDVTAQPPSVNYAGPPRREPFPPATSPAPGKARPNPPPSARHSTKPPPPSPLSGAIDDAEIEAALMPLSFAPPSPSDTAVPRAPSDRPLPPRPNKSSSRPPAPRPSSSRPPSAPNDERGRVEAGAVGIGERPTLAPPPTAIPRTTGLSKVPATPPRAPGSESSASFIESVDDLDAEDVTATSRDAVSNPGAQPRAFAAESTPAALPVEEPAWGGGWEDDPVTSIRRTEQEPVPDASLEYGSTSLEELGIDPDADGDAAGEATAAPTRPASAVQELIARGNSGKRAAPLELRDRRLIEAWATRAEWFEEEAEAEAAAPAKSRLLLAASELWAMSGNSARARAAADQALASSPSLGLASRQARALAALERDFKAVARLLDAEARTAPSTDARAHATYLGAELHRLVLDDEAGANRRFDALYRLAPTDARAYLMSIATDLAASGDAVKWRWPGAPLAPLEGAVREASLLRSGGDANEPRTATVAFEDARRAIERSDRKAAGDALAALADLEGIGGGALFLAAAFYAPAPEARAIAIGSLEKLLARGADAAVRRALAARALERGDTNAMAQALDEPADVAPVFAARDRLALGALAGGGAAALAQAAQGLENDETLRALAAGATAASAPGAGLPVGSPEMRARLALGRRLGVVTSPDEFKDVAHALRAASPDASLGRLLSLELDLAAGATSAVAAEVARWPAPDGDAVEGTVAAALIEELAGHVEIARRHYATAVSSPSFAEAATRALLSPDSPNAADLLAALATTLGDEPSPRRSLLLFEAAVRAGTDDAEKLEHLLSLSHDASTDLPFAARLGADVARSRGDVESLVKWLERNRRAARDPVGAALHAVREALLVADDDQPRAATLLEEAITARPHDVALRTLAERLSNAVSSERGKWRELVAGEAPLARTRSWLLSEASEEYERAAEKAESIRAAREARAAGGSELAAVIAQRVAPEREKAAEVGLALLRNQEQRALDGDDDDALLEVAKALVDLPDRGEALAHARLAVRLGLRDADWDSASDLVTRASAHTPATLWLLRELSARARIARDDARAIDTEERLEARVDRPKDKATLSLRAAEISARMGNQKHALELVEKTLAVVPDHPVALELRASLRRSTGEFGLAALDYEALASSSAVASHQWNDWYRAAVTWLDDAADRDRGLIALEHVVSLDILGKDAFERLQRLYVERGDREKLAALLEARLAKTEAPEERIALEVTRGRALAEVGDRDAARQALTQALEANPDHADALEAFADLSLLSGEWQSAEESFIRLARVVTHPEKQADIYEKLARLYDSELPNPTRAELCYREILKRRPADVAATEALVGVYGRLGQPAKAVQLQSELIERATTNDEKRDRTIRLALVYDEIAKDKKSALAILEKARKASPHDGAVLRGLALFHRRHGETAALNVLLDRAAAEARRALAHGRFEAAFFSILETAAEVRGQTDSAKVAAATLAAIEGRDGGNVPGAGGAAFKQHLDDFMAPEVLSPALRAALKKLPGVLDAAFRVDLRAIKAGPVPPAHRDLADEIRAVAESLGVIGLEVLASPALGMTFLPASSKPARLVAGQALLESDDDVLRYFLLIRALKTMQTEGAAFTRLAPIELGNVTSALLASLAPGFQPQSVDATKVAEARRRIDASLPARRDDDLTTLALEVAGSIGNRASQLGQALNQWASRTALLSVGNPSAALHAIAVASGQTDGPPRDPEARLKWILRQPEAKDLTIFSVSEGYSEARRQAGIPG